MVPERSHIVTAQKPRGRFSDVPDMPMDEHQRRGDAAEAALSRTDAPVLPPSFWHRPRPTISSYSGMRDDGRK